MRLGLSTYTYTWAVGVAGAVPEDPLSAEGLIERAVELGAEAVQIADNLPLASLPGEEIDRLAARADAAGVDIELGMRGIEPEEIRRHLALGRSLGSSLLRTVVDAPSHHPSPREVVETLRPLREDFVGAGVTLAIENHDRFTAAELRSVVDALGTDWAGICLDTVNSFGALEGPGVVVATLAPLTVNLHVKDFVITRVPHAMGFTIEGCPAGRGRLDIPELLTTIRRHRPDVTAVLELWTPPEPGLEDTIAKERAWARESAAFLRRALDACAPGGSDRSPTRGSARRPRA